MYLAAGDYHGALRMLDGIDLIYARNNRGVAYFHLERCEEAGEVFLANWQAKRDNLFALAWAARSRLYRGDEPGAIELCQPLAAATAPRLDDALQQLKLLLLMQRDQDAWDAFQRVVASDWYRHETELGGATLRHYAACAASRLGDAEAVRCLIEFPRLPIGTREERSAFLHLLREEGLIDADQPLELWDGKQVRRVKVFGATILRGDVDTGLPPDLDKLLIEATQDLSGGMFDAAEARLNAILERVPDHPTASGNLAALCIQKGRTQQGRELLERTVATHPDYLVARSNLARLLIQERNFDRAEALLGDPSAIDEIHIEDLFTYYGSLAMLHAARCNDESANAAIALLESLTEVDEQAMLEQAKYLATLGRGYA